MAFAQGFFSGLVFGGLSLVATLQNFRKRAIRVTLSNLP